MTRLTLVDPLPHSRKVNGRQSQTKSCPSLQAAFTRYRLLDEYPSEPYTDVYWIKFVDIDAARIAKKKLDNRSFFGKNLHVCYAPEYESVQDTREKLQKRREVIARKTRSKGTRITFPSITFFSFLLLGLYGDSSGDHQSKQTYSSVAGPSSAPPLDSSLGSSFAPPLPPPYTVQSYHSHMTQPHHAHFPAASTTPQTTDDTTAIHGGTSGSGMRHLRTGQSSSGSGMVPDVPARLPSAAGLSTEERVAAFLEGSGCSVDGGADSTVAVGTKRTSHTESGTKKIKKRKRI